MSYDFRRARHVQEALVDELGLHQASPHKLTELAFKVRMFLTMLDAAQKYAAVPQDAPKPRLPRRALAR
jgi:hypothetical protein